METKNANSKEDKNETKNAKRKSKNDQNGPKNARPKDDKNGPKKMITVLNKCLEPISLQKLKKQIKRAKKILK